MSLVNFAVSYPRKAKTYAFMKTLPSACKAIQHKVYQKIILVLLFYTIPFISIAQAVGSIITDYNGYWKSSASAPMS